MYLCLYHPENGRDTDNMIKWTLSPRPCQCGIFLRNGHCFESQDTVRQYVYISFKGNEGTKNVLLTTIYIFKFIIDRKTHPR